MTAEIAIANAGAVALAADSAVTVGGQKIYNSALKLFSLSKVAPVGVMIYGNAGLMNVPWETLIKTFRQKIGGERYEKLQDYANSFIRWLNGNNRAFPKEAQIEWLRSNVNGFYQFLKNEGISKVHPILKKDGEIKDSQVTEIFKQVIAEHHATLSKTKFTEGMNKASIEKIKKRYLRIFKEIRNSVFENITISPASCSKLYDIAAYIHTKQIFSNSVSGLVIAGYGDGEIYPKILTYDVEGVIEGRLKYRKNEDKSDSIDSGNECRIVAFAQDDMVTTFMNGVNPSVVNLLEGYLGRVFDRLPELLDSNALNAKAKKKFKDQADKLLSGFFQQLSTHIRDNHSHPVLRMVTVLPKDELAAMAEALVNLTAFKRRITEEIETVGGPIDVAVISKGDGLVWVKRKHYFPAELNQHFFRNYFRGIGNGNSD